MARRGRRRPPLRAAAFGTALLVALLAGACGGGGTPEADPCAPGERYCLDDATSAVCLDDGSGPGATVACLPGLACDPARGACAAPPCTPGAVDCLDLGRFRRCLPDGSGWQDPEACPEAQVCARDACRACLPGALTCLDPAHLARCDEEGGGWEPLETCGGGELCHAPSGSCISTACDGGSLLCATPNAYRVCRGAEGWSGAMFPCGLGELCVDGTCVPCPNGPVWCASTLALSACAPPPEGAVTTPCAAFERCGGVPASCRLARPPFCLPGERDCVDLISHQVCAADGESWEPGIATCTPAQRCNLGQCVDAACEDRVVFLVDRSVSMAAWWPALLPALWRALGPTPGVRYGLALFPGKDGKTPPDYPQLPPGHLNGVSTLVAYFAAFAPQGTSPLVQAVERVHAHPERFFEGGGGTLVVVTDGQPDCDGDVAPCVAHLAGLAAALRGEHGVAVRAVGLGAGADPDLLAALTDPGAGPPAIVESPGDEDALAAALAAAAATAVTCAPP